MADYIRNQRSSSRQNHDWSDRSRDSRWDDDRYGYADRTYDTGHHDYGDDSGWQSRYEREDQNRGGGPYSRYRSDNNDDMDQGRWGKSYGRSRNLYDRDYEGLGRGGYHSTRMGGANYGRYGNMDRAYGSYRTFDEDRYGRFGSGTDYGRSYRHEDFYEDPNERNWWDRTRDEVSSWFGDERAERRRDHDRELSHRGKGPKNYNRSDQRILEDVNDRLSDDPFVDATEIEVTVSNGEVTLVGMVEDRGSKRRAEDLADSVSGVKNVENRLRAGISSHARNPEREVGNTGNRTTGSDSDMAAERETTKGHYVTG